MKNNKQTGFTLYELLITVLIVGVILAMGIPNLRQFTQNSRMTSAANDLAASFHLARSEASRAKSVITICASKKPMTDAKCDGTWDQGHIVFIDEDGDIDRSNDETVLRTYPKREGVMMTVAPEGATYFSFAATGLGRSFGSQLPVSQIFLCDERGNVTAAGGNSAARVFVATPLGRATIQREVDLIQGMLDELGESCP